MTKAKSAIDKLAPLPPFDPTLHPPDLPISEPSRLQIQEFQPPTSGLVSHPNPNPVGFYPHQDLCLSLQSFQNPGMVHAQPQLSNHHSNPAPMFPAGFESGAAGNWAPEANLSEMGHFSRLLAWNGGGGVGYDSGGRETLHSSFHPQGSIRAWDDLPMAPDHHHLIPKLERQQQQTGSDGFMGFCFPGQMQGGGGGGGGGQDVHGVNLAYHHNHNSTSSMSTDSSR